MSAAPSHRRDHEPHGGVSGAPRAPRAPGAPGADGAEGSAPGRRRGGDRRARPTPMLSRYWLTGRRRGGRRGTERHGVYVDRYPRSDWIIAAAVMICCVVDAWLTLDLLHHGGAEWNPLMSALIQRGLWVFLGVKIGVTLIGLLFLLIHVHFRRVRRAASLLLVLYTLLMGWHAWVRLDVPESAPAVARSAPRRPAATPPAATQPAALSSPAMKGGGLR